VFNPVTLVVKLLGDTIVTPAVDELPPGEGVKLSKDHVGLPEKFIDLDPVNETEFEQDVKLPPALTEQFWAVTGFASQINRIASVALKPLRRLGNFVFVVIFFMLESIKTSIGELT
jgi:hypothetical protein